MASTSPTIEHGKIATVTSGELTEGDVQRFMKLGYVQWRGSCWFVTDHQFRHAGNGRYAHAFKLTAVRDDDCG